MRVFLSVIMLLATLLSVGSSRADAAVYRADISDGLYGANADDGKDDTAAIQKAIDDLKEGGVLVIPPGTFEVSMGKGLTIAKKHITVIVQGTLVASPRGLESPQCKNLFLVTGEGCRFIGQGGMIRGEGSTFHGERSPAVHRTIYYPALIYFQSPGHEGSITGLRLSNPPGGHVVFAGTRNCKITNCTVEGGTAKVSDGDKILDGNKRHPVSRYMGIFFVGTDGLMIQGNHFKKADGRAQYQWVTSSGSNRHPNTSIVGNVFEDAFDHPIYCSGIVHSVIANNTTRDTWGTAIKLIGEDLVITGNSIYNARYGGLEARNGSRCIVANNLIDQFGHQGISITPYGGGGAGNYTDNIVTGNILIGHTGKDLPPVMAAIAIYAKHSVSRCKVAGNIIHNTGTGNPALSATRPGSPAIQMFSGKPSDHVTISGNTIYNAKADGISVKNVHSSIIKDNIIHCAGKPIVEIEGKNNQVGNNITSENK